MALKTYTINDVAQKANTKTKRHIKNLQNSPKIKIEDVVGRRSICVDENCRLQQ